MKVNYGSKGMVVNRLWRCRVCVEFIHIEDCQVPVGNHIGPPADIARRDIIITSTPDHYLVIVISPGDYDGRTALHLAASEGKLSVMDFLLSYHKSPEFCHLQPLELNPVDRMGCTPLDDAIRHSQKIVELLLRETGAVDKDSEEMKRVRERHEELQKQRLRDTAAATAESNIRGKSEDRDCKMFQELVAKLNSMTSLNTLEKMEPKLEELKLLYAAGGFLKTTKKTKKSSQKNIAAIQECFRSICADIQAEWTSVTSKRLTGISKIPRGFLVGEGFDLELLIEGLNSKVERAVELLEFLTQIK